MRYTILIIITILSFQTKAQSLRGTVTDKNTAEVIPMANVIVKQGTTAINGGATDFDGNYVISPLNPGLYDVEVSFVGYQRTIVKAKKNRNLIR